MDEYDEKLLKRAQDAYDRQVRAIEGKNYSGPPDRDARDYWRHNELLQGLRDEASALDSVRSKSAEIARRLDELAPEIRHEEEKVERYRDRWLKP